MGSRLRGNDNRWKSVFVCAGMTSDGIVFLSAREWQEMVGLFFSKSGPDEVVAGDDGL